MRNMSLAHRETWCGTVVPKSQAQQARHLLKAFLCCDQSENSGKHWVSWLPTNVTLNGPQPSLKDTFP